MYRWYRIPGIPSLIYDRITEDHRKFIGYRFSPVGGLDFVCLFVSFMMYKMQAPCRVDTPEDAAKLIGKSLENPQPFLI